jgi:hypothetical protein
LSPYRIRNFKLAALIVCATAVGVIPVVNATESEANNRHIGKHYKKHYKLKKPGLNSRASGEIRPVARPRFAPPSFERGANDACPGNPHGAHECKIWPPPVDVDPDRKGGGGDGG